MQGDRELPRPVRQPPALWAPTARRVTKSDFGAICVSGYLGAGRVSPAGYRAEVEGIRGVGEMGKGPHRFLECVWRGFRCTRRRWPLGDCVCGRKRVSWLSAGTQFVNSLGLGWIFGGEGQGSRQSRAECVCVWGGFWWAMPVWVFLKETIPACT